MLQVFEVSSLADKSSDKMQTIKNVLLLLNLRLITNTLQEKPSVSEKNNSKFYDGREVLLAVVRGVLSRALESSHCFALKRENVIGDMGSAEK